MSGLRERNKAKRREAILDAAVDLLRSNELANVTIEQIAARAEVSTPTVYNLVGTREQLLLALVDRVVEKLIVLFDSPESDAQGDPLAMAARAIDLSVEAFVADSAAYRQVARSLGTLAVSGSELAFDPSRLHVLAMRRAQQLGILRDDFDPVALGRQSYLTYLAAFNAWASGALSDGGFRVAARHGLATVAAAASSEAHAERTRSELVELGSWLAREE